MNLALSLAETYSMQGVVIVCMNVPSPLCDQRDVAHEDVACW